jgi:hypothetical protein
VTGNQKEREEIITQLARDRRLAHATLFSHRHPQATPEFHYEMVEAWHGPSQHVLTMAFRGAAKSTVAEEAICLAGSFQEFRNCIILGESEARANERLAAIKNEFETNQYLEELFGNLVGSIWQESKIVLANGLVIQAFGRGQSLRGAKHLQWRPDLVFGDDMEDAESVATPEAREKFKQWFMKVVIPALAPGYKFRIAGTPLDPQAWIMQLKNSPHWQTHTYPIEHKDKDGARLATWPSRFPLDEIDKMRKSYEDLGAMQEYQQEYMCEATDPASKSFTADMIKLEPRLRSWEPVYATCDPARTVKLKSAETGNVVFSWLGRKLIIWEAFGRKMRPDEIIGELFRINEAYHPIEIGFEETGLNEWALQPIRQEQVKRGVLLPLTPLTPPKGKIDFIKGLQNYFKAGEIVFACPLPELERQMTAFPTGRMDILNALAYAIRIRPGQPMYDNFNVGNVSPDMRTMRDQIFLCLNSNSRFTTAVAVQMVHGGLHILADYTCEGDPGTWLSDIVKRASMDFEQGLKAFAPASHFVTIDRVGLRPAASQIPVDLRQGGDIALGREELRELLSRTRHGVASVQISTKAQWTLNALAGGYCRKMQRTGQLSEFAEVNVYRVLMEGLESFCALMKTGAVEQHSDVVYAMAANGRRYISAHPRARGR